MTSSSDRKALTAMVGAFPEPDGTQPMTAAELRMVRDYLGVSGEWLAERLGVGLRTVRRWEHGGVIPNGVRLDLEALEEAAAGHVGVLVDALADASDVTLAIPDGEHLGYPAGWWRMVAARVAQEVPGLAVDYTAQSRHSSR